jgi:hypothetical protein
MGALDDHLYMLIPVLRHNRYDLADFFTDFDCYLDSMKESLFIYADFLRFFKDEHFYIEKIMHYAILILIYDLSNEKNNDRRNILIEKIKCLYDKFDEIMNTLKATLHREY